MREQILGVLFARQSFSALGFKNHADVFARIAAEEAERHFAADACDKVGFAVCAAEQYLHGVNAACVVFHDGNDFFVDCGQGFVAKAKLCDCALDGFEPDKHAWADVPVEGSDLI